MSRRVLDVEVDPYPFENDLMALTSTSAGRSTRAQRPSTAHARAIEADKAEGEARPRYHAFDALRGMAMFLVIGLHAALAYIQHDFPGVLWCVRDSPTWPAFEWFCWWSMGVSNPLYFLIAGFFAVILYDSRGFRGFLGNRWRRVAVPFLVAVVTVLPACMAAWAFGWLASGRATWREVARISFRDPVIQAERYGSGHLWFLEYLLVMLLAYAAAREIIERRGWALVALRRWVDRVIASRWAPILLAIPTTGLLWISRHKTGVDAILDRHNSFLIDPVKLIHHASFFVAGVALYGLRRDLARIARPAPWFLALSIPAFAGRAWLLGQDRSGPLGGSTELALLATGALFSWLMVFGALGAAQVVFQRPSPLLSYLADSSYWIYLVHMPIVGLLQGDLYLVPGHALWKFPVVLGMTLALGFASYQILVRHTWVGRGLHGRRDRP